MPNIFSMYTYSSSHFGMIMSYDVTGGVSMEAPIVDPQYLHSNYLNHFSLENIHKNIKSEVLLSLVVAL